MDKSNIFPSQTMFEIHIAAVNLFGRLPSEFIIQLHHQLNYEPRTHLTEKSWVHGSAQEWAKILLISAKTFGRMIKHLVDSDIIEKQTQSRGKSNRANYYSLNYETLRRLIADSHKQKPINTNMWHWFFGTTKIQELYPTHQSMDSCTSSYPCKEHQLNHNDTTILPN